MRKQFEGTIEGDSSFELQGFLWIVLDKLLEDAVKLGRVDFYDCLLQPGLVIVDLLRNNGIL